MKDFVTVFTAQKARQLLKEGFVITDIKPGKTDDDHKRSIFIFRNEEGLLERLKEWTLKITYRDFPASGEILSVLCFDFHFWTSRSTYKVNILYVYPDVQIWKGLQIVYKNQTFLSVAKNSICNT